MAPWHKVDMQTLDVSSGWEPAWGGPGRRSKKVDQAPFMDFPEKMRRFVLDGNADNLRHMGDKWRGEIPEDDRTTGDKGSGVRQMPEDNRTTGQRFRSATVTRIGHKATG